MLKMEEMGHFLTSQLTLLNFSLNLSIKIIPNDRHKKGF